jgi:uncharacterized repeat protein (TIGR01451 family)
MLSLALPVQARLPEEQRTAPAPTLAAFVDLMVRQTYTPEQTTLGRVIMLQVTYANLGPDASSGFELLEDLEANPVPALSFEWDNAEELGLTRQHAFGANRQLRWTGGPLPSNTIKTLQIALRVSPAFQRCADLQNKVTISRTNPIEVEIRPGDEEFTSSGPRVRIPVLEISKTTPERVVLPGSNVAYTIIYTNTGCVDAEEVSITDLVPEGMSFVSASPVPYERSRNRLFWRDPLVPVGVAQARRIDLVLSMDSGVRTGDRLTNTVSITDTLPESGVIISSTASATVQAGRPNLGISKRGPTVALPGQVITYHLTYSNSGQVAAQTTQVEDTLPQGTSFVSSVPEPARSNGQWYEWDLGRLAPNATGQITVVAQINPLRNVGERLVNTAYVRSTTEEDDYTNNESFWRTTVERADVWVEEACPSSTTVGGQLVYGVTFGNAGGITATNVVLTDCFPSQANYASVVVTSSVPIAFLNSANNCRIYQLPDLGPGARGWVTFTLGTPAQEPEVCATWIATNTVTISTDTPESVSRNNSATCATPVLCPGLQLTKLASTNAVVNPGTILTFTLGYTNTGATLARNVCLTDTLPADLILLRSIPAATTGAAPREYSWCVGNLAPGQQGQVIVVVQVATTPGRWNAIIEPVTNTVRSTAFTPINGLLSGLAEATVRVAPACPTTLTLTVTPDVLPADGLSSATVEGTVVDVFGNLARDGTRVELRTDYGTFDDRAGAGGKFTSRLTTNGRFTASFYAETRESVATILAQVAGTREGCDPSHMGIITATTTVQFKKADVWVVQREWPRELVAPGNVITLAFTYGNDGPLTATRTIVRDTLPRGFAVQDIASAPPVNAPTQDVLGTLSWEVGNLATGATGAITITGIIQRGTSVAGDFRNCVTITTRTEDSNWINDSSCITFAVAYADLAVSKTAIQRDARPRGRLSWSIGVSNKGEVLATNVIVTDTLPLGTRFITSTGCSIAGAPRVTLQNGLTLVAWQLGDLLPAGGAQSLCTLILDAEVLETTPISTSLCNEVVATTASAERDESNNRIVETDCSLVKAPDLAVQLAPEPGPFCADLPLALELTYMNVGNATANSVVVVVTFTAPFALVDGELVSSLQYSIAAVDPQKTETIHIPGRFPAGTRLGQVTIGTAVISSSSLEPVGRRDNDRAVCTITARACDYLPVVHRRYRNEF